MKLPNTHWAWSPGFEGEWQADPRLVVVGPALERCFDAIADAISAAQLVSRGARDAVAVVRDPGSAETGAWRVERLLVKPFNEETGYRGIDLEGVVTRRPGFMDAWQPLQSQRQVIVGAIVDGDFVLDRVVRYQSTRP